MSLPSRMIVRAHVAAARCWRRAAATPPSSPVPPASTSKARRFPYNLLGRLGIGAQRSADAVASGAKPTPQFPIVFMQRSSYQHGRKPFYLKKLFYVPVGLLTVYLALSIDHVELTGRRRFMPLPQWLFAMLMEEMDALMVEQAKAYTLSPATREHKFVESIVKQLCAANGLPDLSHKVFVIANDELNASCTGGGTIMVHTGLLHAMRGDRNKVALVVGHEMEHSAEQSGQLLLAALVGKIFGTQSAVLQFIFELGLKLPLSRRCEQEADFIGLMMVARSCFKLDNVREVWYPLVLNDAAAHGVDMSVDDIETYVLTSDKSGLFSTHPTWTWRLQAYNPAGQWMKDAVELQRQTCLPSNLGSPPRVNPLRWWLDRTMSMGRPADSVSSVENEPNSS